MADADGNIHLSANPTVTAQWDRVLGSMRFEGDYNYLSGLLSGENALAPGKLYTPLAGETFPLSGEDCVISGVSVGRTAGDRGYLQLDVVGLTKKYMIQLSMNEISKNIRTWKADASDDEKPKLDKLAEWELWKDKGDQESLEKYNSFCDKNGVKLKDNTLKLAEMIFKGVAEYPEYQPVLVYTFTALEMTTDMAEKLGKKIEKPDMDPIGYTLLGESEASKSEFQKIKDYFIKTGLSSSLNPDGTYTFNVTYMGVDEYEKNIYDPDGKGNDAKK